jgi:hypothetical protein
MRTVLVLHEVDDVDSWLSSPTRREMFGPFGITARTFVDPERPNRVGLVVETPSMELFREAMESTGAVRAMRRDGVRVETVQVLIEG